MRTKTKYRENNSANIPADNKSPVEAAIITAPEAAAVPKAEINGEQISPEAMDQINVVDVADNDAVAAAIEQAAKADESKTALLKQIEVLRQNEQLQRQQAAAMQRPMSREDKIALWQTQGLSDKEASFLREHPQMVDFPQVSSIAANEALAAGIEKDSDDYWKAIEKGFDAHMARLRAQAAAQPTPAFFAPPPAPKPPKPPSNSHIVSAPVSRELPGAIRERNENPNLVRLSAEQLEIARNSGISAADYARGLLRLEREKRAGERQ